MYKYFLIFLKERSITQVILGISYDTNFVEITRLNTNLIILYNTINILQSGMSSARNIKHHTTEK